MTVSNLVRGGIRWSGLVSALGGALWLGIFLLGMLLNLITPLDLSWIPLLLFPIGLVGLYAALEMGTKHTGKTRFVVILIRLLGFTGFILALVGLLIILLGSVVVSSFLPDVVAPDFFADETRGEDWAVLMLVGDPSLILGMMLLGIATIQTKALSRWNGLPLVIGVLGLLWIPFLVWYLLGDKTDELLQNTTYGAMATLGVGWIALGYVLWSAPFHYVEGRMERLSDQISKLAFFDILEYLGKLAILVVVIYWLVQIPDRNRQEHYEAWRVINSAQGQEGTGGRIDALQDLYKDGESLAGLSADDALLAGIKLYDAEIGNADLDSASLQGADLAGANLHQASLWNADLREAYLGRDYEHNQRADLAGAVLEQADLRNANLEDANLEDADFFDELDVIGANLDGATLDDADLTGADLQEATLHDASLQDAHLNGADLRGANLEEANLQGADLQGAKLENAKLWHANVRDVNFLRTDVTKEQLEEQLEGAFGDDTTQVPSPPGRPEEWEDLTPPLKDEQLLKPKDYSLGLFSPKLSFEFSRDGWRADQAESESFFGLALEEGSHEYSPEILFLNVEEVYDPEHPSEGNVSAAPEDLVGWFKNHPHLEVTDEKKVTVGGVPGTQLDVLISSTPEDYPEECGAPCVPLLLGSDESNIWGNQGESQRFIILDVGYETVAISINSLEDEDVREAQEVLETVRFTNFNLATGQTLSGVFKPALSFTVGQGWELIQAPIPDYFLIQRDDAYLSFLNVEKVYDPEHPSEDNVLAAPEDLVGWFREHGRLEVEGKPEQVTVRGVPGVRLDVSVSSAAEDFCGNCVPLFPTSDGGYYYLEEGYENQLYILQVEGEAVVISAESPDDELKSFRPEAQEVISSVKWNR